MADIHELDHDFRLLDVYLSFSAEVARLALLGPVALSFLAVLAGDGSDVDTFRKVIAPASGQLTWSFFFLGGAVAFALLHRYFAIDFLAEHVLVRREPARGSRFWKRLASRVSKACILLAPACLTVGWCLLFLALHRVLLHQACAH